MLSIDGSYGEGGGQILRNTVAISVLTKKPVEIKNIRANRPTPGIKPQHYIAIKSIKELCDAETNGLEVGSSVLTFSPGDIKGGKYKFNIGTAGSITLVFQACILASLNVKEPVIISVTGGTDVKWSPSWDYFRYVFLHLLEKMGLSVKAKLIRRGYYPKGGGEAEITISPSAGLKPLKLNEEQIFEMVNGIINISNLPDHIVTRMKYSAIKILLKKNLQASINIDKVESLSPGTGITLWSQSKNTVLGSTFLGERGMPSEKVGENAANELIREIDAGSSIDLYAFDQLLPYMTIARNSSSCVVSRISNHAQTNMWLLKQFFNVDFELSHINENVLVNVR